MQPPRSTPSSSYPSSERSLQPNPPHPLHHLPGSHPHPLHHPPHHVPPHARRRPTLRSQIARWLGRNWARLSYAYQVEPLWLEINHHDIVIADLPPAFDGYRIAHLSDLHVGRQLPQRYLEEAIEATLALAPDLIALTGDFIHKGYRHVAQAAQAVGRLRAPDGLFAVLGNHDFSVRNALGYRRYAGLHLAVAEALSHQGVVVLRNRTHWLQRGDARLPLCGLDDLWSRECDPVRTFAGVPAEHPRIVLAHNPQTIHLLQDHRWDLLLSGHTHGGQIDWPGLGRITLGKKARQLAAGLYSHQGAWVYVNKGVGFGFRFRFGVRPEIALLTLRRTARPSATPATPPGEPAT